MLLARLVAASRTVAATSKRTAKVEALAAVLGEASPTELPVAVSYMSGELPAGRIGIGHATLASLAPGAAGPPLTVMDVEEALDQVAAVTGSGSRAVRIGILETLFGRASEEERRFLRRLLLGDLRQGALEGLMVEAVARATGVPAAVVRRAHMLAGDLPAVASAARTGGTAALREIRLTVLHPVRPMLAKTAEDVVTAIERLGTAALEYKVDGARIQVHRSGETVKVFTRTLNDVTASVPEVVDAARSLSCAAIVLDGEAVVLDAGGRPAPFQVTMSRFGRRQDVAAQRAYRPLTPFFFDILHLDGHDLVSRSGAERHEALAGAVPASLVVARTVTGSEETAGAFLRAALDAGHEGIMAKALDAPYEAGRRGAAWLKVKPVHTLDLVVLAVEWGSGRRRGWLSNLHLGAREPRDDGFIMLGKTFKGLSDETLAWQTERFLALETHRDGHVVHVRPEQVVEIAFDGIQASPRYPGGMALRFARVKGYRPDKAPDEADTIDTVRAIFEGRR